MNFLSHYYIDRAAGDPLFVIGALLPDIAPHFTKTYNGVIRKKNWNFHVPLDRVHKGILRHYELDAAFHGSAVFKEACTAVGQKLSESGLDREKYRFWFLSHIIVEVMLDRILILDHPGLVNEYYMVLSSVDISTLEDYLNYIVPIEVKTKIISNFMRFMDVKFLGYLDKVDGAADSIIRTAYRAMAVVFSDTDKNKLIIALHNIEDDIRYRRKNLLEVTI